MPQLYAIDASNYTAGWNPASASAAKAAGVDLVMLQALAPPAGYPPQQVAQQIDVARAAGLQVDLYVYAWFGQDPRACLERALNGVVPAGFHPRMAWADVEDTTSDLNPDQRAAWLRTFLAGLQAAFPSARVGIYTGAWFWTTAMGNTSAFSAYPLWDAHYDGIADLAAGFAPYGGWTVAAAKQYAGSSTLPGISGIDLDVVQVEVTEGEMIPDSYVAKFGLRDNQDVQGLIDHFEGVITTARAIAFAQGQAAGADAESKLAQIQQVLAPVTA